VTLEIDETREEGGEERSVEAINIKLKKIKVRNSH